MMAIPGFSPGQYGGGLRPIHPLNIDPLMSAIDDLRANNQQGVQMQQFDEGKKLEREKMHSTEDIAAGLQSGMDRRQHELVMERQQAAWDQMGESITKAALSGDQATFKAGLANAHSQGWKAEQEMVGPSDFGMPDPPPQSPAPPPPVPVPQAFSGPGGAPGQGPPAPSPQPQQPGAQPQAPVAMMQPPTPPPQPPKVPTGKYNITRPDGQVLTLDLSQMRMDQRAAVEPYVKALTEHSARLDKPAVSQVASAFMMDPQSIASGPAGFNQQVEKQAIPLATQAHTDERAALVAAAQSQRQQAGNPIPLVSLQRQAIKDATDSVSKGYAIPEIRKSQQALQRVQSLVKSGGSLQQREAVLQELRAALGSARQSNQQLEHVMQSGGAWTQFETAINRWTGEGKLSPELVKELVSATKAVSETLHDALTDAGEQAYDGIMNDTTLMQTMDPQLQEQAARRARAQMVGETLGTPKKRPPRVGAGGEGGQSESSSVRLKGAALHPHEIDTLGELGL